MCTRRSANVTGVPVPACSFVGSPSVDRGQPAGFLSSLWVLVPEPFFLWGAKQEGMEGGPPTQGTPSVGLIPLLRACPAITLPFW